MRISCALMSTVEFGQKFGVKVVDMFFELKKRRAWKKTRDGDSHKLPETESFVQEELA